MGGPNWDEDLHPRVPAGQSGGGQFAPKGDAPEWKDKEPKWKRDPEWNARKQTAKRMTSKAIIEETGAEYKERNVRDVARELNERSGELIQEEFGRDSITLDDHTPEPDEFLYDVIADELSEGVKEVPSDTWYRDSVQEALTTVAESTPRLRPIRISTSSTRRRWPSLRRVATSPPTLLLPKRPISHSWRTVSSTRAGSAPRPTGAG